MPTKTIASNVSVSAPFTSAAVTLNGSLQDATVAVNITVPAACMIVIYWEQSADSGATWNAFNSNIIDNSGGPAAITRKFSLTMPGVLNNQVRVNVPTLTGASSSSPVIINSVTITN